MIKSQDRSSFIRQAKEGHCPESGCVTRRGDKWRIISNKDGHLWPQEYDTKEDAESALSAYHASRGSVNRAIRQATFAIQEVFKVIEGKKKKKKSKKKEPKKPKKVTEIADAIRRDNSSLSDAKSYALAWETYCSYVNPRYKGCTEKGKSKRKSPKSEYIKD